MRVSSKQLQQAMAKFATGVAVISSLEANGDIHGMTANALVSISLKPPLILVSIGHQRDTYANVQKQGRFGVNVLSRKQRKLAEFFAQENSPKRDNPDSSWQFERQGSPRLEGALVFLECRVVATHTYGDHTIFIAEVEDVISEKGLPLLYFQSQFVDSDIPLGEQEGL